jgi:hypothetical protein
MPRKGYRVARVRQEFSPSLASGLRKGSMVRMPPGRTSPRWTFEIWWALQDLNLGPMDYESTALTAELRARFLAKLFNLQ